MHMRVSETGGNQRSENEMASKEFSTGGRPERSADAWLLDLLENVRDTSRSIELRLVYRGTFGLAGLIETSDTGSQNVESITQNDLCLPLDIAAPLIAG